MTEELVDEICPHALAGQRIDRVVSLIAEIPRSRAGELIAEGSVSVDGLPVAKPSLRVDEGSRIRFAHTRPDRRIVADPDVGFEVVHVDDEVIVVDKPAGLVVHPGAGTHVGTLANGLLARFPELAGVGEADRPGIVHRLDKGTTGLLMVARTAAAHTALTRQLAERTVERRYRTVVLGHLEADRGMVDAPLGRSPRDPSLRAVVADGRSARTGYEVERRGWLVGIDTVELSPAADVAEAASLLDGASAVTELRCRLETGRTHQIRAHLAAIGHPVFADQAYGGNPSPPTAARPGRPLLHAETLGFDHPGSGERLAFASPVPADLQAVLDQIVTDS